MIYDCFPFYQEFELLEIRLNELANVVDRFVLVEANRTHQQREKPLYFQENKERFAKFLPKIMHIVVNMPTDISVWEAEFHQRDQVAQGLTHCADDDVIILGDADEIAKPLAICRYAESLHDIRKIICKNYAYFLNWYTGIWDSPKILRFRELKTIHATYKKHNRAWFANIRISDPLPLYNGGWHFSWLGGIEGIRTKLRSFAHAEFQTEENLGEEKITRCIEQGIDFFDPTIHFTLTPIDQTFPRYIQENQEKFKHLIKL